DRVAEEVVHRDAALHGGDRGEREDAGAVAGRVDAGGAGAGDLVGPDVAGVLELDAGLLEADARGVGDGADGHQAVRSGDGAAVGQGDLDAVADALDGGGAGAGHDVHAAAAEDVLQDGCGVGVL